MRALKNIVWDLDGTLIDPSDGIISSVRFALERIGHPVPGDEELRKHIGTPMLETLALLLGDDDELLLEKALSYYRSHYVDFGIGGHTLYPGVIEALEQLRQAGCGLFLATLKPHFLARRILQSLKLLGYFKGVYGVELKDRYPNKGNLIGNLLYNEGIAASTSIMVGDRASDVAAAKKNGLFTAGVTYGFGSAKELSGAGPDWIFESVEEWIRFFELNKHSPGLRFDPVLKGRELRLF